MKIAIMQPYFFPYIGYFQLMNAVDEFIVYDNIEYTKKGWINRNRILVNGKDAFISLPLKKASDYLNVAERELAESWVTDSNKMLNRIYELYKKAPYVHEVIPVLEKSILNNDYNLFRFIYNSLIHVKEYLGINTPLVISSDLSINHELKSENKVIEICKSRKASAYINPIGGTGLYSKKTFDSEGIYLFFLKTSDIRYIQFNHEFIPFLSIIDVMMFNSAEKIREYLDSFYTLVQNE